MTFKQSPSVLEVLFGVGFGGGEAVKRFVEDANDPLLFGEWWDWKLEGFDKREFNPLHRRTRPFRHD